MIESSCSQKGENTQKGFKFKINTLPFIGLTDACWGAKTRQERKGGTPGICCQQNAEPLPETTQTRDTYLTT